MTPCLLPCLPLKIKNQEFTTMKKYQVNSSKIAKDIFLSCRRIYIKTRILPWLVAKSKIYPILRRYIVWNLKWHHDTKLVGQLMGRSDILKNPLQLTFENVQEITSTMHNDLFNYNPTMVLKNHKIQLFWRISNCSYNPKTNWLGDRKDFDPKIKIEGVGTGELVFASETKNISLKNEAISIPLSSDHLEIFKNPDSEFRVTVEDPRAICTDESLLVLNTWKSRKTKGYSIHGPMALYNCANKDLVLLNLPEDNSVQKNFTIINSDQNVIRLLKSSNPHTILEFDKNNGNLTKKLEHNLNSKSFLHGGSPFILVDNEYYFRVARQRFHLKGLSEIHLSYLVMHDLNFNEIARTKPFVLQKYAFEVCNGLVMLDDDFIFSWGENDKKMYIGVVRKGDLIRFFQEHISM